MQVTPIAFRQFNTLAGAGTQHTEQQCELVQKFCHDFRLPDETRNYSLFNEQLASKIASYKERAINPVISKLKTAQTEEDITACLFLLNRIIDAGAKGIETTYPIISKFNYNPSPSVQVMLAGIYRKTLVPDAFGPLMTMFLKNSQNPVQTPFDPNEEVGGAILEYLRNKSAINNYEQI